MFSEFCSAICSCHVLLIYYYVLNRAEILILFFFFLFLFFRKVREMKQCEHRGTWLQFRCPSVLFTRWMGKIVRFTRDVEPWSRVCSCACVRARVSRARHALNSVRFRFAVPLVPPFCIFSSISSAPLCEIRRDEINFFFWTPLNVRPCKCNNNLNVRIKYATMITNCECVKKISIVYTVERVSNET